MKEAYRPSKRMAEAAWRRNNPERIREIQRSSYRRRRPAILAKKSHLSPARRAYQDAWRAAHPGYHTENTKKWRANYPDRAKATDAQMYANRKAAPGHVTARQWKEILLFYGNACGQCRVPSSERPLTVDHYVPITAGGAHDWTNVWPLCMPCNAKKHTRVPAGAPPHVTVLLVTAARHQRGAAS